MTSNSGPKKPKYNPLNKHGTPATRRDFIEADYVNGVVNEKGEQVIRALNEFETEWLAQFYAETEHGNFAKTTEIDVAQDEYTALCRQIRHAKKNGLSTEEVLELKVKADEIYKKLVQLRAETNTFYPEDKDRHEIFKRENLRNSDIFSTAKACGRLTSYDLPQFDQMSCMNEDEVNPDHLVLDYLTRTPAKKKVPRKKKLD